MSVTQKEILQRTISALESSLQKFPGNEKILHQLALAYAQSGQFHDRALAVFDQASELFPGDIKIQQAVSIGYLVTQSRQIIQDVQDFTQINRESLERSMARLRDLTEQFPDSPELHCALGDLMIINGSDREAIQHYRTAMALGISDLEPLLHHFEMVRLMRPVKSTACVFFAELYERLGMTEKADNLFQELIRSGDKTMVILDGYQAYLERRISQFPNDENLVAESLRRLIRLTLMKNSSPHEALILARQLTPEQLAEDPRLAKDLARILMRMEDFRQAFDYLAKPPMDEEVKNLLNEITVLLEKRGELDTALYLLQYINEHDLILKKEEKKKEEDEKKAEEEWEIEVQTELHLAELHWKNRHWQEALESFLGVLEMGYDEYRTILEPLDMLMQKIQDVPVNHLAFLTNYFAEKREWERCLKYAQRTLQLDPTLTNISQRLLQACEKILIQNPYDYDVRLIYGDEQLARDNIERAMQEFRKAASSAEYQFKAKRRLALAMFKAGDLIGAFETFKSLPVLDQEDIERLYDLMISFANNEEFKQAFDVARLIQEYDPKFRDVPDKARDYEENLKSGNTGFVIDPKMRELIGDHAIGRYKYIAKIGSGGMGVVHKVTDLKTNHVVAMKILREGLSSSGRAIDRFFREARIAATLHHSNIVNILDYNISNNYGQSYIAMEFVDGPSLREINDRKFAESYDIELEDAIESLDWISQLCDALDATHKKGIIHRDIKPDNIMIAKGNVVKITDFGIVHIEEATFTPTGALIGTPRYMSPEQVHGGRIDARSDIYAVGIILYELLIGSPPFISGDISYQQVNVLPTPPKEISGLIPESVNRIIMKCLEKNPSDRYQSAMELKKDVDETYIRLGGDPDRRRPDTLSSDSGVPVEESPTEVDGGVPSFQEPGQKTLPAEEHQVPPSFELDDLDYTPTGEQTLYMDSRSDMDSPTEGDLEEDMD